MSANRYAMVSEWLYGPYRPYVCLTCENTRLSFLLCPECGFYPVHVAWPDVTGW